MCPRYKEEKEEEGEEWLDCAAQRPARDRETRLRINPLDITLIFFFLSFSFFFLFRPNRAQWVE